MTKTKLRARGTLPRLTIAALVALGLGGQELRAAEPTWPGGSWPTATPAQVGMDPVLLRQGVDFAAGFGGAGMVVRQGYAVSTWGDTNTLVNVRSVAKSFGSILMGVAIGDGLLHLSDKAQAKLSSFGLPPSSNTATGWLPQVTVENLATHTAGFQGSGGYIPLDFRPGTAFRYSDGGANWLGDVLTATFAQDLNVVLRSRVLDPIGVPASGFRWAKNPYRPEAIGGAYRRAINSSIYASVDALARVGLLMARGGQWRDEQVLPASYVQQAGRVRDSVVRLGTAPDYAPATTNPTQHYGLLWWNNADGTMRGLPTDAFWAWGLDDAIILVVPSLDLVVARHGPKIEEARFGSYAQISPFLSPIGRSVIRANAAPVVNAGPDLTLPAPGSLRIAASYSDDGMPGGYSPQVTWSRPSGPGSVSFAPANRTVTTVTFPTAGTYVLKLTVYDRSLRSSDTVRVSVGP